MNDNHSDILAEVLADEAHLSRWKRAALAAGLLITVSILLLSWWIREPGDAFIAYIYPVCAGLFLLLLLLLLTSALSVQRLAGGAFLLATALILVRLAWHYHFSVPLEEALLVLAGAHYWSVGAVIVASFLVFERYQGLLSGIAILLLASLIAGSGLFRAAITDGVSDEVVAYLIRVHLFLGVLLVFTSVMAVTREHHHRARLRTTLLDRWANFDQLTGLANRRAIDRLLRGRLAEVERYQRPLSVILMDLDNFKHINDQHGHLRGDAVLAEVARRLKDTLRETEMIGRWGGEEFLLVCPETDCRAAAVLAERCRRTLTASPVVGVAVTATFGVTEYSQGESVEALVGRADRALYRGKQSGRDCVCLEAADNTEGSSPGDAISAYNTRL